MTDPQAGGAAACPTCGIPVALGDPLPAAFPFCSSRCRLRDLGAWLDGRRVIPGAPLPPDGGDGSEP